MLGRRAKLPFSEWKREKWRKLADKLGQFSPASFHSRSSSSNYFSSSSSSPLPLPYNDLLIPLLWAAYRAPVSTTRPRPVSPFHWLCSPWFTTYTPGNDEIENQLKRDRLMAKNEIKMLLLGAGESGKSTVLKQMKLIHHGGYNDQERDSYKEIIFSNTIQSMRCVSSASF